MREKPKSSGRPRGPALEDVCNPLSGIKDQNSDLDRTRIILSSNLAGRVPFEPPGAEVSMLLQSCEGTVPTITLKVTSDIILPACRMTHASASSPAYCKHPRRLPVWYSGSISWVVTSSMWSQPAQRRASSSFFRAFL